MVYEDLEEDYLYHGENFRDSNIEISDEDLNDIFEGRKVGYFEDGKITAKERPLSEREEINRYCYFCDFHEVKPHLHHIIRKSDGGRDSFNNLIPLCANHHECIHRRVHFLVFNPKEGVYYLKNRRTGKVTPPAERQRHFKRKIPYTSIKYSNNLKIEGDLNSKAKISIIDFQKAQRKKKKLKKSKMETPRVPVETKKKFVWGRAK